MTIAVISHPDCALHDAGAGHPENPSRIAVISQAIDHFAFKAAIKHHLAPTATRGQLLLAHDAEYVDWIFSIAPKEGFIAIDGDTIMNPYTLAAALRAAGSTILAVDLLLKGNTQAAFCNVRPPGHHAERDKAMGFCFFNNVAIGVRYAMEKYNLRRIAIVDFDVHRGNGTQGIFQQDPDVLFCSSFEHPLYPGYEPEMDNEHILSVPLPPDTGSKEFREQVAAAWFDKIADFKPQLIFFSAGFDAHVSDPLANLRLTEADYVWLTTQIAKIAKVHCDGRLISVLEGGYQLDALAQCVPAHINAMVIR